MADEVTTTGRTEEAGIISGTGAAEREIASQASAACVRMTADGFAVGEWWEYLVTLELAVEIRRGGIAAMVRNLLHGLVGLGEQTGGAGDPQFVEVLRDGASGALLE